MAPQREGQPAAAGAKPAAAKKPGAMQGTSTNGTKPVTRSDDGGGQRSGDQRVFKCWSCYGQPGLTEVDVNHSY